MAGPLRKLQQRGRRPSPRLSTLAAAETAREVVDEGGGRMAERGHVDAPLGPAAQTFDLAPGVPAVDGLVDRWRRVDRRTQCPQMFVITFTGQLVRRPDQSLALSP